MDFNTPEPAPQTLPELPAALIYLALHFSSPLRGEDKGGGENSSRGRRNAARVFLVGGPVRDILLGRPSPDYDIAIDLGLRNRRQTEQVMLQHLEKLSRKLHGKYLFHRHFLTATLTLPDGKKIDICHTRRETYPRPGLLPKVEPDSIETDLARRDFTINAIALEITPDGANRLIDPYLGARDLKLRLIRILHPASFIDDPTRIFRAVRFAIRLNFEIETGTLYLMRQAIRENYLRLLTPERLLYELRCIIAEPARLKMLQALIKEGALNRELRLEELTKLEQGGVQPGELFTYLLSRLPGFETFPVTAEERAAALAFRKFKSLRHRLLRAKLNHTIYRLLAPLPDSTLNCLAHLETGTLRRKLQLYRAKLRAVRPETTARDLLRLGVKPGPRLGSLLRKVLYARLDGRVRNREEELKFVSRLVVPISPPPSGGRIKVGVKTPRVVAKRR